VVCSVCSAIAQLPDDDPEVWSEILEHAYTSTWSGKASLLMVVKDYADRYGFHELAAEAAADLKERLTNEPNDVMAVAARAISMGVRAGTGRR